MNPLTRKSQRNHLWSRRDVLRAGAGFLTSNFVLKNGVIQPIPSDKGKDSSAQPQSSLKSRAVNPLKVLVIGAGAAGIAAAQRLHDAGHSVTVFEARNRLGGRVLSDDTLAPYPIERGAEFIHGENVLTWDFVDQFNLKTREAFTYDEQLFAHTHDGLIPASEWSEDNGLEYADDVYSLAEEWVDEDEEDDASIADVIEAYELGLSEDVYRVVNNAIASDYSADLDQMGAYGILELSYEGDGESDFRIREGYTHLLTLLAQNLNIQLNTIVHRIEWSDTSATVYTNQGELTIDKIVITLPLGVLQAGDVEFVPPLPAEKQTAIQMLGAGHVDKIILKFREPIWDDALEAVATMLDTQLWWRPGFGQDNEVPVLTALVGGQAAHQLERMTEQEVIDTALADLTQIFPNARQQFERGYFVNWGGDPFAKMGYSYVPVNATGQRAILAQPVGALHFAGEATHVFRAATVHGALETGYRAADEIGAD